MIHCFWEGRNPPAYLTLSMTSWLEYVEPSDIRVYNHSNIGHYLGEYFDVRSLRHFSFAKQSDAVSAAAIHKYGGMFVDVDTVFTSSQSVQFAKFDSPDGFRCFGNKSRDGIHVGVVASTLGGTVARHWAEGCADRIPRWEDDRTWSYLGNDLLVPLKRAYESVFEVVDSVAGGVIAEGYPSGGIQEVIENYQRFWFAPQHSPAAGLSSGAAGIVCLHNSWTPPEIAELGRQEVWDSLSNMGHLLRRHGNVGHFDQVEELLTYGS